MGNFTVEPDEVDLPRGATAGARRKWVRWQGKAVTALSQNSHRAYLFPVLTPEGVALTAEAPIDHPHHSSLTIGTDHFDVAYIYGESREERGTYNFYVNDTFQGRAAGRTLETSLHWEELASDHLSIDQQVEWQGPAEWGAPNRRTLAIETRTIDIHVSKRSNEITVTSRLEPTKWEISIGPTRHAYFTVRIADGLRVVDGGKLTDSEGAIGGNSVSKGNAVWVNASGIGPHSKRAGLTVIPRATDGIPHWYAHDWGSIALNPFLNKKQVIGVGDSLELSVTYIAYDGDMPIAPVIES